MRAAGALVTMLVLGGADGVEALDGEWALAVRAEAVQQAAAGGAFNPGGRIVHVDEELGQVIADARVRLSPTDLVDVIVRDRVITALTGDDAQASNILEDAIVLFRLAPTFQISLGKDRVREGVGYAWNPVDFFRVSTPGTAVTQDPKEQRDHRPGHYAIRAEARWGPRAVAVVFAPAFDGLDTDEVSNTVDRLWLRYSDLVLGADTSFYLYSGERWKGGVAVTRVFGEALEVHGEMALQQGSVRWTPGSLTLRDASGGARRVPVWRTVERHDLTPVMLAGAQYTLAGGVNLLAEYFHNGEGRTPAEWRRVFDAAAVARSKLGTGGTVARGTDFPRVYLLAAQGQARPGEQGRHYAFARVAGAWLATFALVNLEDRSAALSAEARVPLRPGLAARAAIDLFVGARRSEFGALPVDRVIRGGIEYAF